MQGSGSGTGVCPPCAKAGHAASCVSNNNETKRRSIAASVLLQVELIAPLVIKYYRERKGGTPSMRRRAQRPCCSQVKLFPTSPNGRRGRTQHSPVLVCQI